MGDQTRFYQHLTTLADRQRVTPDRPLSADPVAWQVCVRQVLDERYASVPVDYSISQNLRVTRQALGPPARFALECASLDADEETYTLSVEAQYEAWLPYTPSTDVTLPVRPRDYGPAIVVYQLVGDVRPRVTEARADVRAFPGTLADFAPPDVD